ncbi:uncharacterized protein TRIREDRAFT_54391 [Trichoderma reesei QM6a]|uniref:Predicted protein n=1 Tax=Hypocrea jecorina (strain QM6a) TaxID=431241 RepID=G0R8B5_HYPJQ|nr:uncharacterized protein TRIREDRAFT_54391 [Trichoderma reesei QM6a]EGR52852.1 predicted protein [Trichoderma reesei QM6a]
MAAPHRDALVGSSTPTDGYESPTEENQPAFFFGPTPTASGATTPARIPITCQASVAAGVTFLERAHPRLDGYQSSNGPSNLDAVVRDTEKSSVHRQVGLKDRIACYQWQFFTMFVHCSPFFETNFSYIASIAVILTNICQYGAPHCGVWLLKTLQILFWIYTGLSAAASAGLYLILWSTLVFPIHMMTPTWVFPAYPLMLTAPFAGNLIAAASATGRIDVLYAPAVALSAVATQGTGCLISLMISSAFIYRLMTQKLPRDFQRPGVFISIGPYAFTAASIAQLGSQANVILPSGFLGTVHGADIIKVISILVALWLYGLSTWFFLVSVGSLWKYVRTGKGMPFQMTWWSFVFPNTALVSATEIMGTIFESRGLQLFGCAMTIALVIAWVSIFATMIVCIRQKKLLWPKTKA